jgi:hypothetical protein
MVAERVVTRAAILAERMRRQRIASPLGPDDEAQESIGAIQPISTGPFARPGSPPSLAPRTDFDDLRATGRLRRDRTLVKGRFQGGGIGYVLSRDLEIYANAFRKLLVQPSDIQRRVLDALRGAGPLTPRQLKEETGLLNKQIMPALQRLQTAFLVYEDQLDDDWERSWYDFASEWPGIRVGEERRESALVEVLRRFLRAHVFATLEQIRDWTRMPARQIATTMKGGAPGTPELAVLLVLPPPAKPLDGSRPSTSPRGTGNSARGPGTPICPSARGKALG